MVDAIVKLHTVAQLAFEYLNEHPSK